MSNVSITTNKLSIGYPSAVVQTELSFDLFEGEMVCMLGPNGCGKSTLLRTLAGLLPPLKGDYTINPASQNLKSSTQVSLVLTSSSPAESATIHDIVAMGRYPYTSFLGGLTPEDERIISDSLSAVGFPVTRNPSPVTSFSSLSDGEKQRILIAKALAQQTPIILLDEPTAHLDLPHRILVLRLLRRLAHEQHKTILISTHELDLAISLSDRIMLMTPRRGIALDTPEALKKADAFTSAFGMDIFNPLA